VKRWPEELFRLGPVHVIMPIDVGPNWRIHGRSSVF